MKHAKRIFHRKYSILLKKEHKIVSLEKSTSFDEKE